MERRCLSLQQIDPMAVAFPHARTALHIRSWRKVGRKEGSWEDRYYLSSLNSDRKTPEQWMSAVREHWGGVENRNHWRKDACLLEDKTRSRNPNIVCSLILLRSLVFHYYARTQGAHDSLPAFIEANAANSKRAFSLVLGK